MGNDEMREAFKADQEAAKAQEADREQTAWDARVAEAAADNARTNAQANWLNAKADLLRALGVFLMILTGLMLLAALVGIIVLIVGAF